MTIYVKKEKESWPWPICSAKSTMWEWYMQPLALTLIELLSISQIEIFMQIPTHQFCGAKNFLRLQKKLIYWP